VQRVIFRGAFAHGVDAMICTYFHGNSRHAHMREKPQKHNTGCFSWATKPLPSQHRAAHLGGTDGLAQLARDAPLLPAGVAPQGVLSAEARAERTLLERIVDRHLGLEEHLFARRTNPARIKNSVRRARHNTLREETANVLWALAVASKTQTDEVHGIAGRLAPTRQTGQTKPSAFWKCTTKETHHDNPRTRSIE